MKVAGPIVSSGTTNIAVTDGAAAGVEAASSLSSSGKGCKPSCGCS